MKLSSIKWEDELFYSQEIFEKISQVAENVTKNLLSKMFETIYTKDAYNMIVDEFIKVFGDDVDPTVVIAVGMMYKNLMQQFGNRDGQQIPS